ncbi:hypothetical protein VUR80DRAFT_534 [Thermomyces stellatus]
MSSLPMFQGATEVVGLDTYLRLVPIGFRSPSHPGQVLCHGSAALAAGLIRDYTYATAPARRHQPLLTTRKRCNSRVAQAPLVYLRSHFVERPRQPSSLSFTGVCHILLIRRKSCLLV